MLILNLEVKNTKKNKLSTVKTYIRQYRGIIWSESSLAYVAKQHVKRREQATLSSSPWANTTKVPPTVCCTENLPGGAWTCASVTGNCRKIDHLSPRTCCPCCQTLEAQRSLPDHLRVKNTPISCAIKHDWKAHRASSFHREEGREMRSWYGDVSSLTYLLSIRSNEMQIRAICIRHAKPQQSSGLVQPAPPPPSLHLHDSCVRDNPRQTRQEISADRKTEQRCILLVLLLLK